MLLHSVVEKLLIFFSDQFDLLAINWMIKRCPTCLAFQNRQLSELIINHTIPNQAWTKIAADPFRLYCHYYLLIIDYYFHLIFIKTLKDLQSSTAINMCKKIFSQFGTPKE